METHVKYTARRDSFRSTRVVEQVASSPFLLLPCKCKCRNYFRARSGAALISLAMESVNVVVGVMGASHLCT